MSYVSLKNGNSLRLPVKIRRDITEIKTALGHVLTCYLHKIKRPL